MLSAPHIQEPLYDGVQFRADCEQSACNVLLLDVIEGLLFGGLVRRLPRRAWF